MFTYTDKTSPTHYQCHKCQITGTKLWREYNTFANQTALY